MKKLLPLSFIVLLAACKGSSDYSAAANDMCGCFNQLKDSLPADALKVFEKAAVADVAKTAYEEGLKKLSPDDIQKTMTALMSTAKPGSPITDCLNSLDKKYNTKGISEQQAAEKMVEALKGKTGCEIMQTLMRMQVEKAK
jgi:hypothetical protein